MKDAIHVNSRIRYHHKTRPDDNGERLRWLHWIGRCFTSESMDLLDAYCAAQLR
jgi:hypothetical protein